jgi:DNA-nicking Smr family endonuclease
MENEIDLHGFTHDEAVIATEEFVLRHSNNNTFFSCRIITGQSSKMTSRITEMLDKHKFKYIIPSWNTGCILVS